MECIRLYIFLAAEKTLFILSKPPEFKTTSDACFIISEFSPLITKETFELFIATRSFVDSAEIATIFPEAFLYETTLLNI